MTQIDEPNLDKIDQEITDILLEHLVLANDNGQPYIQYTDVAVDKIITLIATQVAKARIEWLDEQISHLLQDIYPTDLFAEPTQADFDRINKYDANLHTRLHCDGIRHGLHILRREVRGLSARDELATLNGVKK